VIQAQSLVCESDPNCPQQFKENYHAGLSFKVPEDLDIVKFKHDFDQPPNMANGHDGSLGFYQGYCKKTKFIN
jgi:hypothetical protein